MRRRGGGGKKGRIKRMICVCCFRILISLLSRSLTMWLVKLLYMIWISIHK